MVRKLMKVLGHSNDHRVVTRGRGQKLKKLENNNFICNLVVKFIP